MISVYPPMPPDLDKNDTILLGGPFVNAIDRDGRVIYRTHDTGLNLQRARHRTSYMPQLRSFSQPPPPIILLLQLYFSSYAMFQHIQIAQEGAKMPWTNLPFPESHPSRPESLSTVPPHFDSKFLPRSRPRLLCVSRVPVYPCTRVPVGWGEEESKEGSTMT